MHHFFCTVVLQLFLASSERFRGGCPRDVKTKVIAPWFDRAMAVVWIMPRRAILSSTARDSLFVLLDTQDEIIRYYTLTESDLAITNQHRGGANRLGFAVQL